VWPIFTSILFGLWLSSMVAIGIRITRWGQEKEGLIVKVSVSLILSEAGCFFKI
jgi:hypothetical protein